MTQPQLNQESLPVEFSPSHPLFFVHVPKVGGTSIERFLQGHFLPRSIRWLRYDSESYESNRLETGQHACYVGHEVYEYAKVLPAPPVVITLLRDPVGRAITSYYWFRAKGIDGQRAARPVPNRMDRLFDLPLGEFLRAEPNLAGKCLGNLQTAVFSHAMMPHLSGRETRPDDLEMAKQNLARCSVVAVLERMAESVDLISQTFGWSEPESVPWANKTPESTRKTVADHDDETLQQLRELTAIDAELYRFGLELFGQQLAAQKHKPRVSSTRTELPAQVVLKVDAPESPVKSPHSANPFVSWCRRLLRSQS